MSEKFHLKWNDFHNNVSRSFGLFRNEDYLHDVTLVSDDNLQISAHKLVLSACSEYFKNIFKGNKHPHHYHHPLVCLSGVSSKNLNNVVDYIYNGEVQIYQEELDSFLDIAQRLKLEGLTGNGENVESKDDVKYEEAPFPAETHHQHKETLETSKAQDNFEPSEGVIAVNSEDVKQINDKIEEYIARDETGRYKCNFCGKLGDKFKSHMRNHIETHLEGLSFPCQLCGKIFRSRNQLSKHKHHIHK